MMKQRKRLINSQIDTANIYKGNFKLSHDLPTVSWWAVLQVEPSITQPKTNIRHLPTDDVEVKDECYYFSFARLEFAKTKNAKRFFCQFTSLQLHKFGEGNGLLRRSFCSFQKTLYAKRFFPLFLVFAGKACYTFAFGEGKGFT